MVGEEGREAYTLQHGGVAYLGGDGWPCGGDKGWVHIVAIPGVSSQDVGERSLGLGLDAHNKKNTPLCVMLRWSCKAR